MVEIMITPFLILHKVRGEPAFDIAHQQPCPECEGFGYVPSGGCNECDGLGHWWIVSTSGHRAYPAWECELSHVDFLNGPHPDSYIKEAWEDTDEFDSWPDHYPSPSSTPKGFVSALLDKLGLVPKIERRF